MVYRQEGGAAVSYDTWLTTPPDTDACSEDFETCPCPACETWRDNREPDDADGEVFRGGEAAAFASEQAADAQKLK